MLTKLIEIRSQFTDEDATDVFVCVPCQETHEHTVAPDAETKEGLCEWRFHK